MMEQKPLPKEDARAQRGMWAPGAYFCRCTRCGEDFIGDKRALWCADCAYKKFPPLNASSIGEMQCRCHLKKPTPSIA